MNFDYEGKGDRELSLSKGDVIGVTKENVAGWSVAKINSKIGLFPSSFASPVKCGYDEAALIVNKIWKGFKFKKGLEKSKFLDIPFRLQII